MYRRIIKKAVEKQEGLYRQAQAGDLSRVAYRPYTHEHWGCQDAASQDRTRLACYLLFGGAEDLLLAEHLFEEELKDRQNNSFQGVGPCLEMLTALLARRNADGRYDELFRQAKNANFDCACGYDPNQQAPESLDQLALADCIGLAVLLDQPEETRQLTQIWKAGVRKWDDDSCRNLLRWNNYLGDRSDHERLLQQKLRNARRAGSQMSRLSASHDLMRFYVEEYQFVKAAEQLDQMCQDGLEEFRQGNLFRFVLEDCMDIILGGGKDAERLWQWSKPWILEQQTRLHGNLYKKAVQAAQKLGDPEAQPLEQGYLAWRQKTRLE